MKYFKYGVVPDLEFGVAEFTQSSPEISQIVIFAVIDEDFVAGVGESEFNKRTYKFYTPDKKGDILFINIEKNKAIPERFHMSGTSAKWFYKVFKVMPNKIWDRTFKVVKNKPK